MKRRTAHKVGSLCRAAALVLASTLAPVAPAQSGRIIPPPTPTPTPEAAPARPPVVTPKFVPAPGADRYRLIFPTGREGKLTYTGWEQAERDRARRSAFDSFVEELNRAGAEGYRLVASLKGYPAVARLGPAQFEYAWQETRSRAVHAKPGFHGLYSRLAKQGFRLADHALMHGLCADLDNDSSPFTSGLLCEYSDLFIFEREKGAESPREHASVYSDPGGAFRKGPPHAEVLTAALRGKMAGGLGPAGIISRFELLLEREPPAAAPIPRGAEVQVVRSSSFWERDELPKKVNEAARQGFRLALVDNGIAVMYRPAGAPPQPLSYVWLRASKKEFERELAALQEAGAAFSATYPDANGVENELIFERGPSAGRREYRVLRFTLETREDAAGGRVVYGLAAPSSEVPKELNRLAAEGFAVLALFDPEHYTHVRAGRGREEMISKDFCLLLERRR